MERLLFACIPFTSILLPSASAPSLVLPVAAFVFNSIEFII
ncbi:hypothetical protein COLO4_24015 [Corchorus olitorius]|uniref:Uncharacterized protein n=1 Tax=Corchorus olitorius TaxID=93759 RepID=A0A1R3IDG6_9ROSI|nr:hypothetical protein COLO4_24015 [Corchorus olitorius]